ncbi:lysophospholipid acyltransferase family protein [Nonomuraea dietziae]|uniref:lysophospholipid acyltransferase family protein n=1 Tax=Nonomuraea dietziae TaxID=65515 RepID=UPI0031E133E6
MSRRPGRPSRPWETFAVVIVKPLSWLLVKKDWRRGELLPRTGGIIIATNHLSWADPVLLSHFLYNNGRWPTILAKAALFRVPLLKVAVRALQAIPVSRGTSEAARSLEISEQRLRAGGAILFYPEGTVTRDPALWPMVGKTGAAPPGPGDRHPGDPRRALGRARAAALRPEETKAPPAQDVLRAGRATSRPVEIRRAAVARVRVA